MEFIYNLYQFWLIIIYCTYYVGRCLATKAVCWICMVKWTQLILFCWPMTPFIICLPYDHPPSGNQ